MVFEFPPLVEVFYEVGVSPSPRPLPPQKIQPCWSCDSRQCSISSFNNDIM